MSEPRTPVRPRGGRRSIRRAVLTGLGLAAVGLVLFPSLAGAQEAEAIPITGQQVNLLWVVIGAVLVIFMQAGFALVETGFCRAKHAAHVVSTNFAIFGLGFVGFFLVGYALDVRRLLDCRSSATNVAVGDAASSAPATGSSCGRAASGSVTSARPVGAGGRSASSSTWSPSWTPSATIPTGAMAERWKWKALRRLGPLLRRHLLPAVRRVDLGRRLAAPSSATRMSLGLGYVDFAGSGVVHAVGGVAGARRRARARSPHRQVQQGRHAEHACPATTSRWPCSARSSCCSAGSASTPPRPSRPPTSSSPIVATNTAHRRRVRRHRRRCSGS